MEIQTHVLTNQQHLDAGRQKTARDNIVAAKKPTNTSVDNFAGFDSDGEIVDSGVAKANLVHDENYVHTDNNYTDDDKTKLDGITGYVKDAEVTEDGKKLTLTKNDNTHVDFMGGSGIPTPTQEGDVLTVVSGQAAWAEPAHVDVSGKMDKVQNATDNLVAFDAEGNAKDSEIATSAVSAALSKLDGISDGANKVEASETNGNIKINNVETPVYTHPTTQVHDAAAVKVGNDAQGHVVLGNPLTKSDVGLGNVDNTSDLAKPISTATQTALNDKADKVSGSVSGHFASLTETGNLADSGCGESDFVQSVEDSETNGNIVVDGTEINVYTHPAPNPNYPQFDQKLYKVAVDSTGHVLTTGTKYPNEVVKADITALGIPGQDTTYEFADNYNESTNKGATVATVTKAINALDHEVTSSDGKNVQVKVTQQHGVITGVSIDTDNTLNTSDIEGKADKVSGATSGNLAGLDANGNLTDSGSNVADFATASQGAKADAAIQGVKANGTSLTPDGNKVVDIPAVTTSSDGLMSVADKRKLDGITDYIVSASASDRTLTLTPKNGESVVFEDTGDENIIEHIEVNGTEVSPVNKAVNISVPTVNDGKLKLKLGSADTVDTGFSANKSADATVTIPNATTGATGVDGLMSVADKTKLNGIATGAQVNKVETVSLGGGTQILPTSDKNIDIPMAAFDDTSATTAYTNGAMSGQDKEKLDKLKNFSKVTISDGAVVPTTADCVPSDEDDTLTFVGGNNVTLTKDQDSNTITIDAVGGNTVSAGRSISIVETPTATGTNYEVSVDGAVGYYGSTKTIPNVSASPTDLLDASAVPNINSENARFVVVADQTSGYVYLYALQTVHDALDSTNDVAGVDIFTLSYNVQVERTPAYGFYGVAGVQLVRKSTSAPVLHSSTESYPSTVGQCSVNGTTTVWNNAGTPTTIDGKAYYGYRLVYVGDVSQGSGDTLGITARFSVVENMSGTAEYTGTASSYTAGKGIEIDQSNEIQAKLGDGLKFNATDNSIEVNLKAGGGLQFENDGSVLAISLDSVTEKVVDTVTEISSDMEAKLTTNFPYPMITDVSYDFGSLNVNGTCICQLFSVPFRHPIKANETYITVYAKDTGYSQTNVMFGIYEYDPAGNGGTGDTRFVCDTGAVSIHKQTTNSVLEFPVIHVNPDHNALYPNCMYYAVLALPPNAGSGIFLASAPNYNAPVNSMPTLNWRMTNINGITWNDPTNATLDKTQVPWSSSGYNEHNSMNRFFMQIRNHVSQNSGN